MQKNLCLFVLFITISVNLFAQKTLERFIHKYAHYHNADYVNIGRLPMLLVRPFIDSDNDSKFLKTIHKVEVLDIALKLDNAVPIHKEMMQLKQDLVKDGYDELMFVKSDGDRVHILGKIIDDNIVKECVLLVDRSDEMTVVHVNGKIRLDEIGNLSGKWGNAKFTIASN